MGSSHHLKRLAMPRSWPLPRKTTVWIARPVQVHIHWKDA